MLDTGIERAGSDLANIVTGPRRVTERVANKSLVNMRARRHISDLNPQGDRLGQAQGTDGQI